MQFPAPTRRVPFQLLIAAVCVLAGCVVEQHASREWAIVGGERTDMNEPAVVLVLNRFGGLCSGTIIAPRVVLTAKHCVQDSDTADVATPAQLDVGVGDSINGLTRNLRVADVWTTPGTYRDDGLLSGLVGKDIALITLIGDSGIPPIPVHRGDPSTRVGDSVKVVGFGQTLSGRSGVKYRVQSTITFVDDTILRTGPTTCPGDSGGPMITSDNEVIGVTSFGRGGCGGGSNGYNRVDIFLEEIDAVLAESGECVATGAEICNREDDDCNGEVDEGCFEVGESCTSSDECSSQRCEETPAGRRCTDACDPLRPYLGCGAGLYCAQTTGCEGWCLVGEAGVGEDGDPCTSNTDCASLLCSSLAGDGQCLTPCRSGDASCFSGEICAAPAGGCGGCAADGAFAEPAAMGEPCAVDADCASGMCFTDTPEPYCTSRCTYDGGCLRTFHCLTNGNLCIRGPRSSMGQACQSNGDCSGTLSCESRGDDRWCSRECEDSDDCDEGLVCLAAAGRDICTPVGLPTGSPCTTDADCVTSLCQSVTPGHVAVCTRACDAENPCESGLSCVRQGRSGDGLCADPARSAPAESSGCGVTSGSTSPPILFTFLLLFLGVLSSRRAMPRRGVR